MNKMSIYPSVEQCFLGNFSCGSEARPFPREIESYPISNFYEYTLETIQKEIDLFRAELEDIRKKTQCSIVIDFNILDDKEAKKKIMALMNELHKKKVENISVFELSQMLRIRADQVERILENEGAFD